MREHPYTVPRVEVKRLRNKKILVLIRGHVADVLSALPALKALRRAYPRAFIAVMVNEYVLDALDDCPYVDKVIPGFLYRKRGRIARTVHAVAVFGQIVASYDVVLGFHNSPSALPLLAILAGARERFAYAQDGLLSRLLSSQLGREPDSNALRERNLRIVQALGVEGSATYPELDWLPQRVRNEVDEVLSRAGISKNVPFAVLQLSCNWGCNQWASAKWAELADFLRNDLGLVTTAIGTDDPSERAKLAEVQGLMKTELISLLGRTTLPQLFELVRRAALAIATDSALTQVTLAQRTPAVVMWGIEPIAPNGPLASEFGNAFEAVQHWEGPDKAPAPNRTCAMQGFGPKVSFCHGLNCRENSSLSRISVAEVKERIERVLKRSPRPERFAGHDSLTSRSPLEN